VTINLQAGTIFQMPYKFFIMTATLKEVRFPILELIQ